MSDRFERVMVVTAHPDDAEFGAAGTIAKLVQEGCEVTYVIVTNGNKGSNDRHVTPSAFAETRVAEQRQGRPHARRGARRVPGLSGRRGRGHARPPVRHHAPDPALATRPPDHAELGSTYNLYVSHRDHRVTGGRPRPAYPLARDYMAFPELMPEHEPHKVREVHVMQWENPQLVVDITDTMELKLKALGCHASQVGDFAAVERRVRERAAELGQSLRLRLRGGVRPHRHAAMTAPGVGLDTERADTAERPARTGRLAGTRLGPEIVRLPASAHTSAEAARQLGCEVAQIAKSLVFRGRTSGRAVLVIASGANRVDEHKIAALVSELRTRPMRPSCASARLRDRRRRPRRPHRARDHLDRRGPRSVRRSGPPGATQHGVPAARRRADPDDVGRVTLVK